MTVPRVGPLVLVLPALLSCAFAAPQGFAYSTTTYQNPFVPIPFARLSFQDYNDIAPAVPAEPPVHMRTEHLPPSPYHFLPASLPQAIYSEPAHVLSGYSYQTLDPAGAKSQVLFVSGPNSQRLFRQNANLLHIVLPSLFTAGGDSVIPEQEQEQAQETPNTPQYADPMMGLSEPAQESSAPAEGAVAGAASTDNSSQDSYDVEARTDDQETPAQASSEEIMSNGEDVTPKDQDRSSDELATSTAASTEKSDDAATSKPDVSNGEESSSLKSTDSTENASENPINSEKNAASDEQNNGGVNSEKSADDTVIGENSSDKSVNEKPSDEKQSDEKASEEKTSEKSSDGKSSEEKKSEDSATDSSNVSTTTAASTE